VANKIGSGLLGKQGGGIRAPTLPQEECQSIRPAINPLHGLLWFLNVISSFDLFAGTDGHDHGWSPHFSKIHVCYVTYDEYHDVVLFKDPRVLRDLRRVPRCRGREIQKILERSVLKFRS
jgi:hypothetical protein